MHLIAAQPTAPAPARGHYEVPAVAEHLYKADHPRAVDRHIDFFGDGVHREATAGSLA